MSVTIASRDLSRRRIYTDIRRRRRLSPLSTAQSPYRSVALLRSRNCWRRYNRSPSGRPPVNYLPRDCRRARSRVAARRTTSLQCQLLLLFLLLVMAALWNTPGHYIFAPCGFFLLSFFLAKSQRPQIGCLPYFYTWCGPSANLERRSEMCCMWLAGNTGRKKSPFWHHRTTLLGYIFGTKACIDNRKKTC